MNECMNLGRQMRSSDDNPAALHICRGGIHECSFFRRQRRCTRCAGDSEFGRKSHGDERNSRGANADSVVRDRSGDAQSRLGYVQPVHAASLVGAAAAFGTIIGLAPVRWKGAEKVRIQQHGHVRPLQVQPHADGLTAKRKPGAFCFVVA